MSLPNKYEPETNVMPPRCQHCGEDLLAISTYSWQQPLATGMAVILALYCSSIECRKLLHTQIVIVPNAQERNIVAPH